MTRLGEPEWFWGFELLKKKKPAEALELMQKGYP